MATREEEVKDYRFQITAGAVANHQFDTIALHAGTCPDLTTGAMLTPIYQTTTYRQDGVGQNKGFTYSRSGNPTVAALERRLAALEGAEFCTCYATGMAATTALCLALLRADDRGGCSQAGYCGTLRVFYQVLAPVPLQTEVVVYPHRQTLSHLILQPP